MQQTTGIDDSAALDTLAALVRLIATHDIGEAAEETKALAEQWARHVLLLSPVGGASPSTRRDWRGLVRFVTKVRKDESETVRKAMAMFRQTIIGLAESLKRAVGEDLTTDQRLGAQLERLRTAAMNESLEHLKMETLSVADAMSDALEDRKRAQEEILKGVGAKLKALSAELEEARAESAQDPLTKVNNRRAFDQYVEKVVALDGMFGRPACLIMIDIDHFKSINDRFGHPLGDEVLRQLGNSLTRSFPRRTDLVARYGGEEFAVVLRDTRSADARTLAARLITAIRAINVTRGSASVNFTASLGIAELGPTESAAQWIARADQALYAAKNTGRDRFSEAPSAAPATEVTK